MPVVVRLVGVFVIISLEGGKSHFYSFSYQVALAESNNNKAASEKKRNDELGYMFLPTQVKTGSMFFGFEFFNAQFDFDF